MLNSYHSHFTNVCRHWLISFNWRNFYNYVVACKAKSYVFIVLMHLPSNIISWHESERDIEMLLHKQSATDTHCCRYKQHLRSTVTCCHMLSHAVTCCQWCQMKDIIVVVCPGSEYLKLYLPWRHQSQMMMLEKSIIWTCQSGMTFLASKAVFRWSNWLNMLRTDVRWQW